jgi:Mg/Co/Ni transporter MgtE
VYQGVVHLQRLLREPPSTELGRCIAKEPTVTPDLSDREVAEFLASYNLLAVGVCDTAGRLLGAITVDDVLDRMLPADWRQRRRQAAQS